VLLFLMEYAPLETWQRDALGIVREEAYYFGPQRQTKIMNEGWASFVHTNIMTKRALTPDELIDYADHHAGTVATGNGRLNPYKIGLELFRDIEDRWNRGAFGPEYEACKDMKARRNWDKKLGQGREKVFEVRRIFNDIGFIETFLTEDFARRHKLFTFDYNERREQYEIASRDFEAVKQKLLFQLTNFGQPLIEVVDANYGNRSELYLMHRHDGVELDAPYAQDTLRNLFQIWTRPVHLETIRDGKATVFSHDEEGGSRRAL
jgi:stage V sporulation protein R